jgi:prevent-host-death family protein
MKTVTAADANRQFSKLLREVQAGEEVVITSHGRPIVRMVAVDSPTAEEREEARRRLLEHLRSQPVLNLPKFTRDELYEDD